MLAFNPEALTTWKIADNASGKKNEWFLSAEKISRIPKRCDEEETGQLITK